MSSYPSADEYAFALEPTRLSKHLRNDTPLLQIVSKGKIMVPKGAKYAHVANGFFAFIYRVKAGGKEYAIRCPRVRIPANSASRYQSLSRFLKATPDATYFVEADHFEDALYVSVGSQGRLFPVQVMGWVTGKTLLEVVTEKTQTKDVSGLNILSQAWKLLITTMKSQGVIHGDLHPDNVIVTPDNTLRLVDYDTLIVPGFTPESTTAGGMITYFHPGYSRFNEQRVTTSYLDDFGAINILLSLMVLCDDPSIRKTKDYLLFSTDDIESPRTSNLFMRLLHHPNTRISELATAFFEECCEDRETGKLCVEHFTHVIPSLTNPQNTSHGNIEWQPSEEIIPSSVGKDERRTREVDPSNMDIPSSDQLLTRRTYSYEPK